MYAAIGTYYLSDDSPLSWLDWNPTRTTDSHLKDNNKYQLLYTYGCTS